MAQSNPDMEAEGGRAPLTCRLCARALPTGSPGRQKGKTWTCRHCLSMETLLYRNLGGADKQGWTVESKGDFFRKAASLEHGTYTWNTVKTMIINTQTERRVKEQVNKVKSKALPLNVWLQQGYSESHVKQFPDEVCPIMGQLFAVPVKETSLKEIRSLIEEEIQQKEKDAQKTKGSKRSAEGDAGEDWDIVPHSGKTSAPAPKRSKTQGEGHNVSEKASAKAEKQFAKAAAKANKANDNTGQLAAKATAALTKSVKLSEQVMALCQKHAVTDEDPLKALQLAVTQGQEWNQAAVALLPLVSAARGTGARLSSLPFTGKDLQEYCKATATLQKNLKQQVKAKKDEAAARDAADAAANE